MTGRLNGVGEARRRRCAADDLFSRICSEPPGQGRIKAPAGSRARNRVSKSARFRPAAERAAGGTKYSGFSRRASGPEGHVQAGADACRLAPLSRETRCRRDFLIQKISNYLMPGVTG
ncbi:hypothetical protein DIE22_28630 [Burkholderia sp. Bp9142]|nr:hypothetical protein DIE22_28630 [Burkholderia sp. Bp9142]RQR47276.1 hypothetical protein DIE21_27145 [Burkholderia sp. Bp9140]